MVTAHFTSGDEARVRSSPTVVCFIPGAVSEDVPEAGWIVRQDMWGQRVAGEVMHAALRWFDETHGPRRIACMIEEGNVASERVAARLSFVQYDRHMSETEPSTAVNLFQRLRR